MTRKECRVGKVKDGWVVSKEKCSWIGKLRAQFGKKKGEKTSAKRKIKLTSSKQLWFYWRNRIFVIGMHTVAQIHACANIHRKKRKKPVIDRLIIYLE